MSLPNPPDDANPTEPAVDEGHTASPTGSGGIRGLIFFLALAVGAGVFAAVLFFKPPSAPDTKLAAVSLLPLEEGGEPVTLRELQGKVVLLNFWGEWCDHCKKELPDLAAIQGKFKNHPDFRLLAVSCGANEKEDQRIERLRKTTEKCLYEHNVDLPAYLDPDSKTRQAVADALGGWRGYPTTLLLDRQQRVRGVWIGATGREAFAEAVGTVLKEKP